MTIKTAAQISLFGLFTSFACILNAAQKNEQPPALTLKLINSKNPADPLTLEVSAPSYRNKEISINENSLISGCVALIKFYDKEGNRKISSSISLQSGQIYKPKFKKFKLDYQGILKIPLKELSKKIFETGSRTLKNCPATGLVSVEILIKFDDFERGGEEYADYETQKLVLSIKDYVEKADAFKNVFGP